MNPFRVAAATFLVLTINIECLGSLGLLRNGQMVPAQICRLNFQSLRGGGEELEDGNRALLEEYQERRQELKKISERFAVMSEDRDSHIQTAEVLAQYDGNRPCFRSIGGVLMQSNVSTILSAIKSEEQLLDKATRDLEITFNDKTKELRKFEQQHDIKFVRN
eukprot:752921-Hanusia_phi.AAC.1